MKQHELLNSQIKDFYAKLQFLVQNIQSPAGVVSLGVGLIRRCRGILQECCEGW